MKHPRPKTTIPPDAQIGLGWYTREQWQRLIEVVGDRSKLNDTFEDWERNALSAVREIESQGRLIRKVMVNVEALMAWCRERGCRMDGAARAEYVVHLIKMTEEKRPWVVRIWNNQGSDDGSMSSDGHRVLGRTG